jgi:Acyl carrier protein
MREDAREQVRAILSEVLETEVQPEENPVRNETPGWDSLTHIELILRLEEQFRIRFSAGEVSAVQSMEDLVRLVEVKS